MRDIYRHFVAVCFVICGLVALASGQTTRPAPSPWMELTQSITDAAVAGDTVALTSSMSAQATIRQFGDQIPQTPDRLVRILSGAMPVSIRAYSQTPATLASDIAADFESAQTIPDEIRKDMTPDPSVMSRANATATLWITQTLAPSRGQSVAVIVLWSPPAPTPTNLRPLPSRPVFVLIKGQMEQGVYRIKQVVYGDPRDEQS